MSCTTRDILPSAFSASQPHSKYRLKLMIVILDDDDDDGWQSWPSNNKKRKRLTIKMRMRPNRIIPQEDNEQRKIFGLTMQESRSLGYKFWYLSLDSIELQNHKLWILTGESTFENSPSRSISQYQDSKPNYFFPFSLSFFLQAPKTKHQ